MWFFLPDSNVAVDQNINKNNFEKPGFLVLPAFHFHTSVLSLASCGIGGIGGGLAWPGVWEEPGLVYLVTTEGLVEIYGLAYLVTIYEKYMTIYEDE